MPSTELPPAYTWTDEQAKAWEDWCVNHLLYSPLDTEKRAFLAGWKAANRAVAKAEAA